MAHGKMKTLFGLYKKVGRDAFLEAATYYSDHVCDTVDATLDEMETRWYDSAHTMTEAEKWSRITTTGSRFSTRISPLRQSIWLRQPRCKG